MGLMSCVGTVGGCEEGRVAFLVGRVSVVVFYAGTIRDQQEEYVRSSSFRLAFSS
jgi:hypothetical protein